MKYLTLLLCTGLATLVLASATSVAQIDRSVTGSGAVVAIQNDAVIVGTIGQSIVGSAASTSRGVFGFWNNVVSKTAGTAVEAATDAAAFGLTGTPNPVSGTTVISFALEAPAQVSLVIYNELGEPVRDLIDGTRPAGPVSVRADLKDLPSSSYTGVLNVDGTRATVRLIVVD